MKSDVVRRLILYIVDQLQDREGMISKTRIVKLLYLVDIEYYRIYRETLTGLDWIFYRYGPYAFAIDTVIEELGLDLGKETIETTDKQKAYVYHVHGPQTLDGVVEFVTKLAIDRVIERWALEDTRCLLDYVYTATEPMQQVTFLQRLDFSSIRDDIDIHRPTRHLRLSKDKSAIVQKLLQQRHAQREAMEITPPRFDELYSEAIDLMNQEDMARTRIVGKARISPKAAESISQQVE